jgi:hypothetical protein
MLVTFLYINLSYYHLHLLLQSSSSINTYVVLFQRSISTKKNKEKKHLERFFMSIPVSESRHYKKIMKRNVNAFLYTITKFSISNTYIIYQVDASESLFPVKKKISVFLSQHSNIITVITQYTYKVGGRF